MSNLSHVPIRFGGSDTVTLANAQVSINHEIPCLAHQALRFSWAVYSFDGCHFSSTITSHNLSFCVTLACDQHKSGCAILLEFTSCTEILTKGSDLFATAETSYINHTMQGTIKTAYNTEAFEKKK